jgi:hypothetical protein
VKLRRFSNEKKSGDVFSLRHDAGRNRKCMYVWVSNESNLREAKHTNAAYIWGLRRSLTCSSPSKNGIFPSNKPRNSGNLNFHETLNSPASSSEVSSQRLSVVDNRTELSSFHTDTNNSKFSCRGNFSLRSRRRNRSNLGVQNQDTAL